MKTHELPVSVVCLIVFLIITATPAHASRTIEVDRDVNVTVGLGGNHFFLFGYTSPGALVHLQGLGLEDTTFAQDNGYFEFDNRLSPFLSRDTCLTSQDQFGRLSPAVCIPPFPVNYDVNVGPVIMPPTMSLDKNNYYVSEQVVLTGQSIPNSPVSIAYFNNANGALQILSKGHQSQKGTLYAKFITPGLQPILRALETGSIAGIVDAYSLPPVATVTDEKGNFSFALPSTSANTYRLFTQTEYENQPSPKSITLYLKILPVWMILIQLIGLLWGLLMKYIVNILIVLQLIGLIVITLRKYWHPWHIYKGKALMKIKRYPLMKRNQSAAISPYSHEYPIVESVR